MNVYSIQMYVEGTEENARSLRKSLAQSVRDEFDLRSVFGVKVNLDSSSGMNQIENLSKENLLNLLKAYDCYIQKANEDNRYREGWFPVCVDEFFKNEYQLLSDGKYNQPDNFPQNYSVEITETLQLTVSCVSTSSEEAEEIIRSRYDRGEYVLSAENFTDVQFNILSAEIGISEDICHDN